MRGEGGGGGEGDRIGMGQGAYYDSACLNRPYVSKKIFHVLLSKNVFCFVEERPVMHSSFLRSCKSVYILLKIYKFSSFRQYIGLSCPLLYPLMLCILPHSNAVTNAGCVGVQAQVPSDGVPPEGLPSRPPHHGRGRRHGQTLLHHRATGCPGNPRL